MKHQILQKSLRVTVFLILIVFHSVAFAGSDRYEGMTFDESIEGVSEECPEWILGNQVLIDVIYWGFDGQLHQGQLVADARVADDLLLVFMQMFLLEFPMESVIPICEFGWDDDVSMEFNNTSAFNYRCVPGTDRLSNHSYGLAIDINPVQNPYYSGGRISPEGAVYDVSVPGTLYEGHPVVSLFKYLGWRWGGDWGEPDYQHFDKRLEEIELSGIDHHIEWPSWRLL